MMIAGRTAPSRKYHSIPAQRNVHERHVQAQHVQLVILWYMRAALNWNQAGYPPRAYACCAPASSSLSPAQLMLKYVRVLQRKTRKMFFVRLLHKSSREGRKRCCQRRTYCLFRQKMKESVCSRYSCELGPTKILWSRRTLGHIHRQSPNGLSGA